MSSFQDRARAPLAEKVGAASLPSQNIPANTIYQEKITLNSRSKDSSSILSQEKCLSNEKTPSNLFSVPSLEDTENGYDKPCINMGEEYVNVSKDVGSPSVSSSSHISGPSLQIDTSLASKSDVNYEGTERPDTCASSSDSSSLLGKIKEFEG
jgi:hypothetical protein